jgi:hypothetical protein
VGSRDPGLNTIGYAGSASITPRPVAHVIKKPKGLKWEYQIAAGNAGWPVQFRFAVHILWSRVPELWTLGSTSFMKIPHHLIALGAAALLAGCAAHVAKTEAVSAGDYVLQLHQQGRLPGDSKDAHGKITCYLLPSDLQEVTYPLSRTFRVVKTGGTSTNNYTVVRLAKDSSWQLQRAWQTDSEGRVIQEWPVK